MARLLSGGRVGDRAAPEADVQVGGKDSGAGTAGEAWGNLESRQSLERAIEAGQGGCYLRLTPIHLKSVPLGEAGKIPLQQTVIDAQQQMVELVAKGLRAEPAATGDERRTSAGTSRPILSRGKKSLGKPALDSGRR